MESFFHEFLLLLAATVRISTPLILAAFAGMFAERSGIVDIGLEGKMLAGAFAAAAVAYTVSQPPFSDTIPLYLAPWIGLVAAIIVSVLLALLHAYACVTHHGSQIVSGVAINIIVAGLTITVGNALFGLGGNTPALTAPETRFLPIHLSYMEEIARIPIIGDFIVTVVNGQNIIVYIAFLLVPIIYYVLYKTKFGLQLRATGENPSAVDTAGLSVAWIRYKAMILCGILCGIAGAYLSTAQSTAFIRDMTAGKGFLALAALIFGRWRPYPTLLACLFFGFADGLQARLQGTEIFGVQIPGQAVEAIPYILTVLVLAGFVKKAVPPKAIGVPYVKE